MSQNSSLASRILQSMTPKEKIKMVFTILLCITIIVMTGIIRAQHAQIQTLKLLSDPPVVVEPDTKPVIDPILIIGELQSAAELSTAEISYTGVLHIKDGSFLAKKAFFMIYHADVRAGVDFKKFKQENIVITDTSVTITLPKVEIFESNIKEDQLTLIDEKKSIFNPPAKEDLQQALIEAKADLDMNLDAKALMSKATKEVENFIEKFIRPYIGDRTLEIKYQ